MRGKSAVIIKIPLILIAIFSLISIANAKVKKFPVLHISSTIHEFTPVVAGTDVVYGFNIQNRGEAPLNIHKVKTQ
ncbi:MAG: hypothetical protein B6230_03130 [Desulfobacteraceae bacterium 4572_89]|nr:MAG: hypothetical protein B6230_03130 [Desulfobacteraceae bacterium 4572_89]